MEYENTQKFSGNLGNYGSLIITINFLLPECFSLEKNFFRIYNELCIALKEGKLLKL